MMVKFRNNKKKIIMETEKPKQGILEYQTRQATLVSYSV